MSVHTLMIHTTLDRHYSTHHSSENMCDIHETIVHNICEVVCGKPITLH